MRYWFYSSFENSDLPCIVRESPTGGDPHVLGQFSRVCDPVALHGLCVLANQALSAKEHTVAEYPRAPGFDPEDIDDE